MPGKLHGIFNAIDDRHHGDEIQLWCMENLPLTTGGKPGSGYIRPVHRNRRFRYVKPPAKSAFFNHKPGLFHTQSGSDFSTTTAGPDPVLLPGTSPFEANRPPGSPLPLTGQR